MPVMEFSLSVAASKIEGVLARQEPVQYLKHIKPALQLFDQLRIGGGDVIPYKQIIATTLKAGFAVPDKQEEFDLIIKVINALDFSNESDSDLFEIVFKNIECDREPLNKAILDKLSESQRRGLLLFAIGNGNLPVVSALYDHGLDLNIADSITGMTPLFKACVNFKPVIVEFLLAHGVVPPKIDEDKFNPMMLVIKTVRDMCQTERFDVAPIAVLLHLFDAVSKDGKPNRENYAIALALCEIRLFFPKFEEQLDGSEKAIFKKAEDMFFEELLHRRILGHINGLKNFNGVAYERSFKEHQDFMRIILTGGLYKFAEESEEAESAKKLTYVANTLNGMNPDMYIIQTGFHEHTAHIVFDTSGYMVICNRGAGIPKGKSTIEGYWIDPQKVTPEILSKLDQMRKKSKAEFMQYVYVDLPAQLSHEPGTPKQDGLCMELRKIAPKMQKVGNCYWASLKAAVRVVAALKTMKECDPVKIPQAAQDAKQFSKDISTTLRHFTLFDYEHAFDDSNDFLRDAHLIQAVTVKNIKREAYA